MQELSEHELARDDEDECIVCGAADDEHHDLRMHDSWEAGDDATWD